MMRVLIFQISFKYIFNTANHYVRTECRRIALPISDDVGIGRNCNEAEIAATRVRWRPAKAADSGWFSSDSPILPPRLWPISNEGADRFARR